LSIVRGCCPGLLPFVPASRRGFSARTFKRRAEHSSSPLSHAVYTAKSLYRLIIVECSVAPLVLDRCGEQSIVVNGIFSSYLVIALEAFGGARRYFTPGFVFCPRAGRPARIRVVASTHCLLLLIGLRLQKGHSLQAITAALFYNFLHEWCRTDIQAAELNLDNQGLGT